MLLAERPTPTGAFDFEALTPQGIGRVLRYANTGTDPNAELNWQPVPDEYAIGFPLDLRNGMAASISVISTSPTAISICKTAGDICGQRASSCASRPMLRWPPACANPVRRMSTDCKAMAHGASDAAMSRRC
jgi:hypothetical protein